MNIDVMETLTRMYTHQLHDTDGFWKGTGLQSDGIVLWYQEKPNVTSYVSHLNKMWGLKQVLLNVHIKEVMGGIDESNYKYYSWSLL